MKKTMMNKKTTCLFLSLLLLAILAACGGNTQEQAQVLNPFVSSVKGVAANLAVIDDAPEPAMRTGMTYFNSLVESATLLPLENYVNDGEWGRFEYYLREAHGRYSAIFDRICGGEPLTEEDRAYLDTLQTALETLLDSMIEEDGRTYRREVLNKDYLSQQIAAFSSGVTYGRDRMSTKTSTVIKRPIQIKGK